MTALLTLLFGCASHRAVGPACATGDIPGRSLVIRVIGGAELAPYKSSSDVRSETIAEQLLFADGSAGGGRSAGTPSGTTGAARS